MASPPDTLLVNGSDLRTLTGIRVYGDMNLFAPGLRRGGDDEIPGRPGEYPTPGLPLAAYNFSVFVYVSGATRGAKNANLHAAASVLNGTGHDGLVTLTRRLANSGDTGYDEFYASGRFLGGLNIQLLNPTLGKAEFQFRNLDGGWYRSSDNVFVFP